MNLDPDSPEMQARQAAWRYRGEERPPFAVAPQAGQESVWDYPRPPALVADKRKIVITLGRHQIAATTASYRILETASAPTFYLPPGDVDGKLLEAVGGGSICEWKGRARYWDVVVAGQRVEGAAWAYPDAGGDFAAIAGYLAFYPSELDCRVDGKKASAQPGGFYGGWVTDELVGPFKGEPGTGGW